MIADDFGLTYSKDGSLMLTLYSRAGSSVCIKLANALLEPLALALAAAQLPEHEPELANAAAD